MAHWAYDSFFYHIYPLGFCQAPLHNHYNENTNRLSCISDWIGNMKDLGVNALYLGPLFQSVAHGYDTTDYYTVDQRLGTNEDFKKLSSDLHNNGIKVILDGVFNHVGRDFWAFQDVLKYREQSVHCGWFHNLNFHSNNCYNDNMSYEGWQGHYNLVKLNLTNPYVKEHIFNAVEMWIREFNIDGLRLDVAYCMDINFLKELSSFCKRIKPDFWLMGEVLHGDYRRWLNPETLDSVTNYECYKGLFSSFNDRNLFEIASSFNRQFGDYGLYKGQAMYNFIDNHDVNRISSTLRNPNQLYPLYAMLMTMPGIPSVYYGSEWGIEGCKDNGNDEPLRPDFHFVSQVHNQKHKDLAQAIKRFAKIKYDSEALKYGKYQQLAVFQDQLAFLRQSQNESIVVVVNASNEPANVMMYNLNFMGHQMVDILNNGETYNINGDRAMVSNVPPNWARILRVQ